MTKLKSKTEQKEDKNDMDKDKVRIWFAKSCQRNFWTTPPDGFGRAEYYWLSAGPDKSWAVIFSALHLKFFKNMFWNYICRLSTVVSRVFHGAAVWASERATYLFWTGWHGKHGLFGIAQFFVYLTQKIGLYSIYLRSLLVEFVYDEENWKFT